MNQHISELSISRIIFRIYYFKTDINSNPKIYNKTNFLEYFQAIVHLGCILD